MMWGEMDLLELDTLIKKLNKTQSCKPLIKEFKLLYTIRLPENT